MSYVEIILKGFKKEIANHFMRPLQLALWERNGPIYFNGNDPLCIGDKKRHEYNLDIVKEFFNKYGNDTLKFAVSHYNENSHDGNERLALSDEGLYNFLKSNYEKGMFENTAIIMYSDHGDRFNEDRRGSQG